MSEKISLENYLRSEKIEALKKFDHPSIFQVGLDFSDSAYFWLVVAVITSGAYCLHCRFPSNVYIVFIRICIHCISYKGLRMYLESFKSFQGLFEAYLIFIAQSFSAF